MTATPLDFRLREPNRGRMCDYTALLEGSCALLGAARPSAGAQRRGREEPRPGRLESREVCGSGRGQPGRWNVYFRAYSQDRAGTTFQFAYVMAAFQVGEFLISDLLDEAVSRLSPDQQAKLQVIAGHRAECLRSIFPVARWLTLVRNPIDRAVSVYLHARHHPDAWDLIGRETNERNITLKEFVEEDLFFRRGGEPGSVHNQQTRSPLGPAYDPSVLDDRPAITESIRSRFYLCGYTEAFELFLFYLHITEGWPLVLFANRLVRKERLTFKPDADALAAIEYYNRADSIVYQCARQEFDRRVAEIWNDAMAALYSNYLPDLA